MKSKKTIKKLEFSKETVARLEDQALNSFFGGKETETGITVTYNNNTCTCVTATSRLEPCAE